MRSGFFIFEPMDAIYLDNAATTSVHPEVLTAMFEAASVYGNPSSLHGAGRKAKAMREWVRKQIAAYFKVSSGEVYFTSGATEANNIAISSALKLGEINRVITSELEHASVLSPCRYFAELYGKELVYVPHDHLGRLDLAFLAEVLKKGPALIALMHGNNEIANINPIEKIGALSAASGSIFHSDIVQSVALTSIDPGQLGLDSFSFSAHKFHGPKGLGVLVASKKLKPSGVYFGGGQEKGVKPGTENMMGVVGLGKAFELLVQQKEERRRQLQELKQHAVVQLKAHIPGVVFNGDLQEGLPSILNFQVPTERALDMVLLALDLQGIHVSGGSACSSGSAKGSHVIEALEGSKIGPSIRISFSAFNTLEEVDFMVKQVQLLVG